MSDDIKRRALEFRVSAEDHVPMSCGHPACPLAGPCKRAPMPDTKGTTTLLTDMLETQGQELRAQAEELGKLRHENEGLRAQVTELKRKLRSKK